MKAWRKHNMIQAGKIAEIKKELNESVWLTDEDRAKLEKKLSQEQNFRITHKEAKTFFAPEVPTPSTILYTLFLKVGLPTPPEFKEAFMEQVKKYRENMNAANTQVNTPTSITG